MDQYEKMRQSYKPFKVKVLFIGESRPEQGTFFYNADSKLFDCIATAFEKAFDKDFDDKEFLDFFRKKGCYLEDLCHEPVNKFHQFEREKARKKGVPALAEKIKNYQPEAIIVVMRDIVPFVVQALELAKTEVKFKFHTPFPAGSQRNEDHCIEENVEALQMLIENKIL